MIYEFVGPELNDLFSLHIGHNCCQVESGEQVQPHHQPKSRGSRQGRQRGDMIFQYGPEDADTNGIRCKLVSMKVRINV